MMANSTALERLRKEILTSGRYDSVPLVEVDTTIGRLGLAESITRRQQLALEAIDSLVGDGLMEFEDWDMSLAEALERTRELYIASYRDPIEWEFKIWLRLTDAGRRVAESFEAAEQDRDTSH